MARDVGDAEISDRVKQCGDGFFFCVNERIVRVHIAEGMGVGGDDEWEAVLLRGARGFFVSVETGGVKPCVFNGVHQVNVSFKKPLEREIAVGKRVRGKHETFGVCGAIVVKIGKCPHPLRFFGAVEDDEVSAAAGIAMPAARHVAPSSLNTDDAGVCRADVDLNARDQQYAAYFGVCRVRRRPRGFLMAGDGKRVKPKGCGVINALLGAVRHKVLRIVSGMKMEIGFDLHDADVFIKRAPSETEPARRCGSALHKEHRKRECACKQHRGEEDCCRRIGNPEPLIPKERSVGLEYEDPRRNQMDRLPGFS